MSLLTLLVFTGSIKARDSNYYYQREGGQGTIVALGAVSREQRLYFIGNLQRIESVNEEHS
jgi:hypothetical protein